MTSFGQDLKSERELRGISLKEIADSTKISLRFLKDLEEDRLENLPGKFLTKSIIRTYARYIGLDEDQILNKYYETLLHKKKSSEEEQKKKKPQQALPKKIKNLIVFASLFVLFISILTFIYIILPKKETVTPEKKLQSSVIQQAPPDEPKPISEPEKEEDELILILSFEQETWIQVYADGELQLDGIKQPGERVQIIALQELLIHTGNAGGFFFTLNDKRGKPLGASGAVKKNIRISFDNIQEFLQEE